MANQKEHKCIICGKTRLISSSMFYLIKNGKNPGKCKSCALKGNKRSLYGEMYDTKKYYNTPLYRSWYNMKSRCTNPKASNYNLYGGRGIDFQKSWETFANFLQDMGNSYKEGLSIERIDNNKGYSKENCRWATHKEQSNNTRRNRIIELNGTKKTLSEWSDYLGIKSHTITQRLDYYGWSVERTLSN